MSTASQASAPRYLTPQWPAPASVHAAFTLREGGVSTGPFGTLNLGAQVGDLADAVAENRRRVQHALGLNASPLWLEQVHGTAVFDPGSRGLTEAARADAVVVRRPGAIGAIQVADCLPVLFATPDGTAVAAAHAGWRGLAAGVLEATVAQLGGEPSGLLAWLGPAIGREHFEVGEEVRHAFLEADPAAQSAFTRNARGRWQCDLTQLARQRLRGAGVTRVFGGTWCTYADRARFFSFRRDGQCGRMAALIWRD